MRTRTTLFIAVCVALSAAACSRSSDPTTTLPRETTTLPATTTSAEPATTTTAAVGEVTVTGDFDEGLVLATAALYGWMHDHRNPRPPIPSGFWLHLLDIERSADPIEATATVEELDGESVAVVHAGDDLLLAVADPTWRIVGGDVAGADGWFGRSPRKLLVIGSDARAGENQQRLRADSIHIVTIVPSEGGAIVGFPRDSWVTSPAGTMKFTNVMAGRGPGILLETTESLTGLDLEGYVVTGFKGFQDLIGELGGLLIDLPGSITSGVPEWGNYPSGEQKLSPERTLRLARIRKTLATGDFARSANQGLIMLAGMEMVQAIGIDALPSMVRILLENAWSDLSTEDLVTLAAAMYTVAPADLANAVAPGTVGSVSGQSVVYLSDSASDLYRDLRDGLLGD